MLQAQMRNMLLLSSDGNITETFSGLYYEPGFNIMSPLDFEFPVSDRISIRLRKRDDETGLSFGNISYGDMSVTVSDPTNGQSVPYTIENDGATILLLTITNALTLNNPAVRVRVIDAYVKDTTDNDFISFRILVNDQDKYW